MSDVILRIQSSVQQAVEGVRAFKAEVLEADKASAQLAATNRESGEAAVAAARKQIAVEQEQIKLLREQIAVAREVTSSYEQGSEARQLATKAEIDLQRKLQAALGETAVASSRAGKAGRAQAEESGVLRGVASRSGIAGTGLAALAGPGFIAGAVAAGTIGYGIKAAIDEQKAQANLVNALKDTGNAREQTRKRTEDYISTEERLTGFTRDEITQTLSQLIRSTGDLSKARQDESIMADIARARQTDLAGAQMLVLRASMGNVGALRRLGIDIPKVTTYTDELKAAHLTANVALAAHAKALDLAATKQEVMRAVTQKFAGDSKTYMGTFAGTTATLRNTVHDLAVELGEKAIPPLTTFLQWVLKGIAWLRQSKAAHDLLHMAVQELRLAFEAIAVVIEHVLKPSLEWLAGELRRHQMIARVLEEEFKVMFFPLLAADQVIRARFGSLAGFFKSIWATIVAETFGAWDLMKIGAVKAVLAIIEPFSHLPGDMGKWARDMKDSLHSELDAMSQDAARQGQAIGEALGGNAYRAVLPSLKKIADAFASATDPTKVGMTPGQISFAHGVTQASLPGGSGQGAQIARAAFGMLGTQYVWGGGHAAKPGPSRGTTGDPNQPEAGLMIGLDCSGFARAALAAAGISVPPLSADGLLRAAKQHPSVGDLQPGDLVFYEGSHPNHVAVYIGGGKVIHDPHAGKSAEVADLHMMPITGTARFTDSHPTKSPAVPKPPSTTSAADAAFQQMIDQASAAATLKKTASRGLKTPSYIGLTGAITAELQAAPHELDAVEKNAVAHIKKLRSELRVGMSATDLAKDKVELAKWGKVLRDEIAANAKEATKAAAAHKAEIKAAAAAAAKAFADQWRADTTVIDRAISEQWANVQKSYDRETQKHLTDMQRKATAGIQTMQRAFELQMRDFDRQTQTGLDALVVAQTPEEQALANFVSQRDAANQAATDQQQQTALQAAYASGDPQQIAAALDAINQTSLDKQQAGLQAAADASRKAQDAKTASDQQAYQDQRDALKQSLQDDENTREQARQDTYDADQQAYQDQRDAQWQHLQDMHDDQTAQFDADLQQWDTWLTAKKKSWADFLAWLKKNPLSKGFDPGSIIDPADSSSSAGSGSVFGPADALSRYLASHPGAGGAASTSTVVNVTNINNPTVLGATAQQVGSALEQLVTPAAARTTRYSAPF